jgi:hypothetical protein
MVRFYLKDKNTGKTYGPVLGMITKDGRNEYIIDDQHGGYESICIEPATDLIRVEEPENLVLPPKHR